MVSKFIDRSDPVQAAIEARLASARDRRKARVEPQERPSVIAQPIPIPTVDPTGAPGPGGAEFGLNVPPQIKAGPAPLPLPVGPRVTTLTKVLSGALGGAASALVAAEAISPVTTPSAQEIVTSVAKKVGKVVGGAIIGEELGPGLAPMKPKGAPPMPAPGTGQPVGPVGVGQIQVGGQVPAMGTIVKVWDTWPGAGVTGGGLAPIFFRTLEGKTYVRKLDGTVKRVPKSRNIVLNSRNLNLRNYIKIERAMERITGRIAKASKRLKRS